MESGLHEQVARARHLDAVSERAPGELLAKQCHNGAGPREAQEGRHHLGGVAGMERHHLAGRDSRPHRGPGP